MPDPGETRQELNATSDNEHGLLRRLMIGWREIDIDNEGLTVAQALRRLDEYPSSNETLRSALLELPGAKGGMLPSPRSIGMKLHHARKRVIDAQCFDSKDVSGTAVWFVQEVRGVGVIGLKGLIPVPRDPDQGVHKRIGMEHGETSASSPTSPMQRECHHSDPTSWEPRDGKAYCRGCGKYMGRVNTERAQYFDTTEKPETRKA